MAGAEGGAEGAAQGGEVSRRRVVQATRLLRALVRGKSEAQGLLAQAPGAAAALLQLAVGDDCELSGEASETVAVLVEGNAEVKQVARVASQQLQVQL